MVPRWATQLLRWCVPRVPLAALGSAVGILARERGAELRSRMVWLAEETHLEGSVNTLKPDRRLQPTGTP